MKMKTYGITFSANNGVEIDFKSIEGLKMIIYHLGRLLMRMIDHWGHLDERRIMKQTLLVY